MLKRTIEKYVLPAAAAAAAPAASGAAGTTAAAGGGAAGGGGGAAGGAARAGAAGEVAKGMPKGGAGMDPGSAIRQAGAQTAGFVNAFSSIPDSAGGRYRADLERIKAQRYAGIPPRPGHGSLDVSVGRSFGGNWEPQQPELRPYNVGQMRQRGMDETSDEDLPAIFVRKKGARISGAGRSTSNHLIVGRPREDHNELWSRSWHGNPTHPAYTNMSLVDAFKGGDVDVGHVTKGGRFYSLTDPSGGTSSDLERFKAQRYAAKHPSWSVPFSTKERTSPGLAAHSFASHEGFGGRAAMLLSDLAAGIHERNPSTPLADAVHQAAKDMVAKGVASPDVASFAQHGPSSIGREKFGSASAEYPIHPSLQHPGGDFLGGKPYSGM